MPVALRRGKRSPSHPVGSELIFLTSQKSMRFSLHPTRWARNIGLRVGGLFLLVMRLHPTQWAWNIMIYITTTHSFKVSPSHTVGSKNRTPPASIYADLEIVRSPSHAVGSEQRGWVRNEGETHPSPSHTVGLERRCCHGAAFQVSASPSHTVGSEPACCGV